MEKKNDKPQNEPAAEEKAAETAEQKAEKPEKPKKETKKSKADTALAELAAVKEKNEQLQDTLLRTVAEYDNFRKRSQKEKDDIYANAKADVLTKLLPALDNLERATGNTADDAAAVRKGVEMTLTQLREIFTSLGIEAFGEVGEQFDPNLHSAILHEDDDDKGENEITAVFQKGYKIGEKVVRPAMVKVVN